VRFSSDGRSFSSTDRRGITKHWSVPEPARGDPADLQAELEMWSRTRLADTIPAQLSNQEWQQRKAAVDRFPPGQVWLSDPIPHLIWHEARATDAEGDGNWYLAWWHLKQLVAARPGDWQLHARLGRVNVLRGELATAAADFAKVEQLAGYNALLDWFAHCAYTCREDQAWRSALYFLKELSVAEPNEWQWPADQEEALTKLGQKEEAHHAFIKALQLCHDRTIPKLADDLMQKGDWTDLQKELGRAERVGWLSLDDWKLWVRSARQLNDRLALSAVSARFQERAGPNCPMAMEIGLELVSPSTRSTTP
jgi:tetratricopeptide (TPR) repeat protein